MKPEFGEDDKTLVTMRFTLSSKSEKHSSADDQSSLGEDIATSNQRLKIRIAVGAAVVVMILNFVAATSLKMATNLIEGKTFSDRRDSPLFYENGQLITWWDQMPADHQTHVVAINSVGEESNIHPGDYAGPESCRECHPKNYESWSTHPHRFMNAYADESTVKGDFSGNATINYFGGLGEFYQEDGGYRMKLTRDNITRVYTINQTIGSRFTQYYVGKMTQGPEPTDHEFYKTDHVLPFGYWMNERKWIPIVHVHSIRDEGRIKDEDECPSDQRLDPFTEPGFQPYTGCTVCHTTFPLADLMVNRPEVVGQHIPHRVHFSVSDYLKQAHPDVWKSDKHPSEILNKEFKDMTAVMTKWEAPDKAVNLGISCEACHLGSKAHVNDKHKKPDFFVKSPHLHLEGLEEKDFGRTQVNVNYMCSRCHVGERPSYAGGMSTWNSTEYSDATRGSCYSELRCIDCHDPHEGIGQKWKLTPSQDDQSCIRCHEQFTDPDATQAHTHHEPNTAGSRCMNCHMPRMNEGLQDVVRTHMIFSPTNRAMIERNHPNACNMCHTEQPIDWTLAHLKDWYEKTYSEERISKYYPNRNAPVAINWLADRNWSVRLVATDSLIRTKSFWAMGDLLEALDDPFLINRQFVGRGLEQMLDIDLEDYGYQFYMTADERRESLEKLRKAVQAMNLIEETSAAHHETDTL